MAKLTDFNRAEALRAADTGLLEALRFSYEKWKFLVENLCEDDVGDYTMSDTCPLCIKFQLEGGIFDCNKCPIGKAGHGCCENTSTSILLWYDALGYVETGYTKYKEKALEFVALLKQLYEEERDKHEK